LQWKMLACFMTIWPILRPFDTAYGHLIHHMADASYGHLIHHMAI
jgi:hypothetical protein